ncbi:MAG: T9SS type A sorting domain-containing protein [Breznakibacter sp.]
MKNLVFCIFCFLFPVYLFSQSETPLRFQVDISTSYPGEDSFIENDHGVIILPRQYSSSGKPVPLIIGCHGGGGTVSSETSQLETSALYQYLVSLGYAVMDMAGMPEAFSKRLRIDHNRCLGSYVSIRAYEAGYQYVINKYNLDTTRCYVIGGSNGGLTALNLVRLSNIPFVCLAGVAPLVSIGEQAWNIPLGAYSGGEFQSFQNRANIIRLYRMKDVFSLNELKSAQFEKERVSYFDPFDSIWVNKFFVYCPVMIWHSVNDEVLSVSYSIQFVKLLNSIRSNNARLITLAKGGHSPLSVNDTIVLNVFYQNGTLPVNSVMFDIANWLYLNGGISPGSIPNINVKKKLLYYDFLGKTLYFKVSKDLNFSVFVVNVGGEIVQKYISLKGIDSIPLNLDKGIYIVQVICNNRVETIKINI